jgi:membrane-associated protease RseP (regulator of RpoE activity)
MSTPVETTDAPAPEQANESMRGFRQTLVRLRWILLLTAGIAISVATHNFSTVLIVVGIIVMIMVHEFGHFITAKWSGMKVTEYFLGFGPRLWSFRKGETDYGVKGVPAGGYVRIIGMNNLEEVDAADESRTYRQQPFGQRIIVVSAGSFMHFVMAFLLAYAAIVFVGTPEPNNSSNVGAVSALKSPSPATQAGLRAGDKITAIDGTPVSTWNEMTSRLASLPVGQASPITITRNGQTEQLILTPVDRRDVVLSDGTKLEGVDPSKPSAFIGISPGTSYITTNPFAAVAKTGAMVGHDSVGVVKSLGHVFSPTGIHQYYDNVTGQLSGQKEQSAQETRLLSPVGVVTYAHDAARSGWYSSLMLLFAINLFVGIFNMIPLLPFDGGHVAVAVYEKIRSTGRKHYYAADFAKLLPVSYAVLLILVTISLSSLWLDIVNPAPNPFQ